MEVVTAGIMPFPVRSFQDCAVFVFCSTTVRFAQVPVGPLNSTLISPLPVALSLTVIQSDEVRLIVFQYIIDHYLLFLTVDGGQSAAPDSALPFSFLSVARSLANFVLE